jgi:hypothetical protein
VLLRPIWVLAGELGEPAGGLDRVELAVDPDLLQLVDQNDRRVAIGRDVARRDVDREPLVGPSRCMIARLGAVLGDVGAVAGNGRENIGRYAPAPRRRRQHRPADVALPFARMSIKLLRSSVSARRRSGLSKGCASRLTSRLVLALLGTRSQTACGAWLRVGKGQFELAGGEGEDRGRAVGDDRVFDTVEIGPPRLPVTGIADQPDALVRLELDKFKRAAADRVLPYVARRDVAWIDRRVARGDQRQDRRLRPLQDKGGFRGVGGGDFRRRCSISATPPPTPSR